jgi:TP901 family phage tail tape measure protein
VVALTHDPIVAKSGQASVEVIADFAKLASTFQRDLNKTLMGVRVDMSPISDQIADGLRDGVERANAELRKLGDPAGESFNLITQQSKSAGAAMAASFTAAGRQMSRVGDQMSMALTLPIVAAGAATVNAAGGFEKAMNRVKALSGATADEFARLREQAIALGSTTQYSASQAADAMGYLSMAGFSAAQTLDALPGVLSLAAAGAIELADAADIASNILSGYGFQAKDLGKVNDILAKTFTSTNTTLMSLGETFKYVGPVAASASIAFEEISAAIGLMGNAGIQGSEAGTALRGAIARLLKPTADVTATLTSLGVSVTDSGGKLLPLVDIVRQLETAGADTADMMTIFGLEAGPAMQALVSQGSTALTDLTMKLRNAGGTADRIAKTQMEGFNGSLDELKSAAEGLMIAIGDAGLLGWMTSLAKTLTGVTASMSAMNPVVLKIATIAGIVIAAIGPFLAIFGRMATAIGEGVMALQKFGAWALRVAPWLSALSGPIGWAIAAVIALGVAAVVAYNKSEAFRAVVDRAFRAVGDAALWMWQSAILPAFNWLVTQTKVVGAALARLWGQAQPIFTALGASISKVWNSAIKPALGQIGVMFGDAGARLSAFWSGTAQPALSAMMAWFGKLAVAIREWWAGNGDSVMATAAQFMTRVGDVMTTVWSGVMAVLKGVAAVLIWVFVDAAIPIFRAIIAVVSAVIDAVIRMKPVWMVLGAVIVAAVMVVVAIVKVLWAVVSTAFRAIGAILQWLWSAVIVPAFKIIGAAFEAAGAVISWLWSAVIQPVFLFIADAIGAVGTVIIWLWTSVFQPAFQAIGAVISWVWSSVIQPVFSFIAAAIGVVVSVVQWFWNTFGPIWSAIANLMWTIWSGVLSIVFDLLRLAFFAVVAVVQIFWEIIKAAFMAVAAVVMAVWSGFIQPILSAIGALFSWLWSVIQPVLSAIGAFFMQLWSSYIKPVVDFIAGGINWLWGVISSIFNAIAEFIASAIARIVATAMGIAAFVNNVAGHFSNMVSAIREKIDAAVDFVRGLPGRISSAIGNLGSLLYEGGRNVVQGLINGISSMIGAVKDKISSVASTIRNALPFSPAKYGPLSGRGSPDRSGEAIATMLADGMVDRIPELRAAITKVATTVASPELEGMSNVTMFATPLSAPRVGMPETAGGAPSPAGQRATYNLTVNALDPRSAASAVIEAIAAWERSNGAGWRR